MAEVRHFSAGHLAIGLSKPQDHFCLLNGFKANLANALLTPPANG